MYNKKNILKISLLVGTLVFSIRSFAQDFGRNNQAVGQFNYASPSPNPSMVNPGFSQNVPRPVNFSGQPGGYINNGGDDSYYRAYQNRVDRVKVAYDNQFSWTRPPVSLDMSIPYDAQLYFENYNNSPSPGNTNSFGEVLVYGKPDFPSADRPQMPLSMYEKADYSSYGPFGATVLYNQYPLQPSGGYVTPNIMPRSVFNDGINNTILAGTFTHGDDHDFGESLYDAIEKTEKKLQIGHGRNPSLGEVVDFVKKNEDNKDIASLSGNSTGNQPISPSANLPNVDSAALGIGAFQGKNGILVGDNLPSAKNQEESKEDPEIAKKRKVPDELLQNGDLHEAILTYQAFLLDYPEDTKAMLGIAKAYQKNQQFKAARDVYVKLLSIDPSNEAAMINLIILISEQHPSIALAQLFELEKANPTYAAIPAQIAGIYMQNSEFEEAIKSLKRASTIDSRNTNYKYAIAVCYEYLNFNEEALQIYKDLYRSIKKNGLVFSNRKDLEERIYLLTKYLEQNAA
jgi:tetratricopeptide (TPR) repeat protein